MDFSLAGSREGVVKFAKVVGWVAVSGAVVALADFVANLDIPADNFILVASVGLVNAGLAGLQKWISTKS